MRKSDIGLIGLAVMGENLVLNMESKGYKVSVYNRTSEVTEKFISTRARGKNIEGFIKLDDLVNSLDFPRKVMIMVRAGKAVDQIIDLLIPLLTPGDIIIDGGNSNHLDTTAGWNMWNLTSLFYWNGCFRRGGGALKGPAIMPGGSIKGWPFIKPIFQSIAAKAEDGSPCCDWIGGGGAGHFVKMVHNGIEYGDMQLISEAYSVMKTMSAMKNDEIAEVFSDWNKGKLQSYLIEITSEIMKFKNKEGEFLIDKILDSAGQKGTGKWSVINAMELGLPLNLIASAVFERSLSSQKETRYWHQKVNRVINISSKPEVDEVFYSLYASKLVSYAQGFVLMQQASIEYGWNLDFSSIAKIWRNGCIIRSGFLNHIAKAYKENPELINLLLDPYFKNEIDMSLKYWKSLVSKAALSELSLPAFSSAINYFYSLTTENLPANLIQAQRDYFGAHTFERKDRPRGDFFHENWTGEGGETSSRTYNV